MKELSIDINKKAWLFGNGAFFIKGPEGEAQQILGYVGAGFQLGIYTFNKPHFLIKASENDCYPVSIESVTLMAHSAEDITDAQRDHWESLDDMDDVFQFLLEEGIWPGAVEDFETPKLEKVPSPEK